MMLSAAASIQSHTSSDVARDFQQIEWDATVEDDCRQIVRLAVREDLDRLFDWTTLALVPSGTEGKAAIVARRQGVVAGLRAAQVAIDEMDVHLRLEAHTKDGQGIDAGQVLAALSGPARSLLTAERILLNLIGRMSGVATLSRAYVDAVSGTRARIYDTRKTTPGWRRLEKYAVRCGGGNNHRSGLYDAILIKDNHLALAASEAAGSLDAAEAVRRARRFAETMAAGQSAAGLIVEVEVDSLSQLEAVLPEGPDLVLLDNMGPEELRRAVQVRDRLAAAVELEASGGVTLANVGEIARTGVERISVGALTHSAVSLDVGMDWK
jgi:nicotinate-nucleotide pyrophosphorylase (carboxylating)